MAHLRNAILMFGAFVLALGIANPIAFADKIAPPSGKSIVVKRNEKRPKTARGGYALLVGCTKYDHRPQIMPLLGPANDVELLRHVLEDSYGFDPTHIVVLSEEEARTKGGGAQNRPVRKSIEREFQELARKAQRGDEVVILLSGHGSQQPDDSDPEKADELDGLDEIFLPADIGEPDAAGRIPNAVIDDELGTWTAGIAAKGAHVFLIADCCHSGTMLRGDVEISREVPADVLGSQQALDEARARARRNPPRQLVREMTAMDRSSDSVVALYAAKADETAPERPMPYGESSGKRYGVLTFTLCKLLVDQAADKAAAAAPLTYRELGQRIQAQYVAWGRLNGPTPFVDAAPGSIDREVLGDIVHLGRSRIVLSGNPTDGWTINAGRLHGITKNSVLAVYPTTSQTRPAKPIGHVVVTEARVIDARVGPIKYGESPEPESLPKRAICTVVKLDFGELRIPIAVDMGKALQAGPQAQAAAGSLSPSQRNRLQKLAAELKQRENEPDSCFRVAPALSGANWAVQYRMGNLLLLPIDAAQIPEGQPLRGGTPSYRLSENGAAEQIVARMALVARAQNLIAIAKNARHDASSVSPSAVAAAADNQRAADPALPPLDVENDAPRVQVELLKCKGPNDKVGAVMPLEGKEIALRKGDWIAFRITNLGRGPVDFTLLFIGSDFGITAVFPRRVGDGNRLEGTANPQAPAPARPFQTRAYRVNDRTIGHEHLVAIAVPSTSVTDHVDFTFLSQSDVGSRQRSGGANGSRSFNSALGRLLRQAMYRDGGKRGLDDNEVGQHDAQLLSWDVVR